MSQIQDAKWRAQISGALLDLTKEVRELSEIVHKIAVKLAEDEERESHDSVQ